MKIVLFHCTVSKNLLLSPKADVSAPGDLVASGLRLDPS